MVIFFFQAEDGIRDGTVTGVQTCALPISPRHGSAADRVRARRNASNGRTHRLRDVLDRGNDRRHEAARHGYRSSAGGRRNGESIQGDNADRYAGGDELLPAWRDPAVRAQAASGGAVTSRFRSRFGWVVEIHGTKAGSPLRAKVYAGRVVTSFLFL